MRFAEIFTYPVLVWLVKSPRYKPRDGSVWHVFERFAKRFMPAAYSGIGACF